VSELDSIVSVSITADSTTPSRTGFGTQLIVSYHTRFAENYRLYSSLAEMSADGFQTYDDAYRMAARAFAQNPAPASVCVGRLPAAPAYRQELTITSAVEGEIVKCTVVAPATGTATEISYTIGAAETTSTVATAVELLIEAVAGVDSAAASAVITVTPTTAGRKVHIYGLQNCTLVETTVDGNYDDFLTTLENEYDDWYFITTDTCSQANVNLVATWVASRKKLYFVSTNADNELAGTGTLGSSLSTNERVVILWTVNSHEFAANGWAAVIGVQDPGSITAALKRISGVTTKRLTTTQKNNLETDNINHYLKIARLDRTRPGKTTYGEWIDIRHGIDALEARIQEDAFGLLASAPKVPYTAGGLDLVRATVLASLKVFEGKGDVTGLIAEGTSSVLVPAIADISPTNKSNRELNGVRFSGTLEGAVHALTITGTLSY